MNSDALQQLLGQLVTDLGAAVNGALVVLGDRLGIYATLAEIGPVTSQELAAKTGLDERQLREWLSAQAASGYITYDAARATFSLTPEQAAVFADPNSPVAMTGGFYSVSAVYHDEPMVAESFRTGSGVPWGKHHDCLFCGTERFFRPGYEANLCSNWIPALEGVEDKLISGITVADIGCGHGASTLIMAKAFPNSKFYGFDNHPASIAAAKRHAKEQGVGQCRVPRRHGEGFSRSRLRICDDFRRPPRYGRSGRRGLARPEIPGSEWDLHDCGAPRGGFSG